MPGEISYYFTQRKLTGGWSFEQNLLSRAATGHLLLVSMQGDSYQSVFDLVFELQKEFYLQQLFSLCFAIDPMAFCTGNAEFIARLKLTEDTQVCLWLQQIHVKVIN